MSFYVLCKPRWIALFLDGTLQVNLDIQSLSTPINAFNVPTWRSNMGEEDQTTIYFTDTCI